MHKRETQTVHNNKWKPAQRTTENTTKVHSCLRDLHLCPTCPPLTKPKRHKISYLSVFMRAASLKC